MTANSRVWPVVVLLSIVSAPLLLMYLYLFVDTLTITATMSGDFFICACFVHG